MPRLVNIKNKQTSLNYNRYFVGSGVGSKSRSVQKALMRRASNNAQGEPCCFNNTPSNLLASYIRYLRNYFKINFPSYTLCLVG